MAHVNVGKTWKDLGIASRALVHFESAGALAAELGYGYEVGFTTLGLGWLAESTGDVEQAELRYREAISLLRDAGNRDHLAGALSDLGALLALDGRAEQARAPIEEAMALSEQAERLGPAVLGACCLAMLPGGDLEAGVRSMQHAARIEHGSRMRARFVLWKAGGDAAHLAEAHRHLMFFRDHAPEECRESVLENVALHRDIVAAWEEIEA
jgi:tetratricopeptide (TPR) repeat protein